MSEEDLESPYCEVCGTCGYIGCCGIRNFIEEHIEGKTNCKNEDIIINELINLCDYRDEVFEENKKLHSIIKEVRQCINDFAIEEEDYSKIYNQEEQELLNILDKVKENK